MIRKREKTVEDKREIENEINFELDSKKYVLRTYINNEETKGTSRRKLMEKINDSEAEIANGNIKSLLEIWFESIGLIKTGTAGELMKEMEKMFKEENFKNKTFIEIEKDLNGINDIKNNKVIIEKYYLYGKLKYGEEFIGKSLIEDKEFLVELLNKVWKRVLEEKETKELITRYDVLISEIDKSLTEKTCEKVRSDIAKKLIEESRIYNFFKCSTQKLIAMSDCANSFGHHLLAGEAREYFCREFLAEVLPSDIEYFTGQLVNVRGRESHQLDIILQSRNCPKMTITKESILAFYGMAMAVIEVKTTLRQKDLKQFLNQCFLLKQLQRENNCFLSRYSDSEEIYREIQTRNIRLEVLGVPHILIAFSSELSKESIGKMIDEYLREIPETSVSKFMYLPEMIIDIKGKKVWKQKFDESKLDFDNGKTLSKRKLEVEEVELPIKELFLLLTDIFRASQDLGNKPINKYIGVENYI